MPLLILLGGAGAGAPPFDPAPYAGDFGNDPSLDRPNRARWYDASLDSSSTGPTGPTFVNASVDWGHDAQPIRSNAVRWFDPSLDEVHTPQPPAAAAFDPASGFPWQEQPQDWRGGWAIEGWDQSSSPHPGYTTIGAPTIALAQIGSMDGAPLVTPVAVSVTKIDDGGAGWNYIEQWYGATLGGETYHPQDDWDNSLGIPGLDISTTTGFSARDAEPLDIYYKVRYVNNAGAGAFSNTIVIHVAPHASANLGTDTTLDRDQTVRWIDRGDLSTDAPVYPSLPVAFDPTNFPQTYDGQQDRDRTQRWTDGLFSTDAPVYPTLPAVPVTTAQLAGALQEQSGMQRSQPWLPSDVQIGVSTESDADTTGCWFDTATALAPDWWARFGEAAGSTVAADEVGSLDGTYVNTPTLEVTADLTGDTSTAVRLVGASTEYVQVPDGAALDGGDVFTVAFRFRRTTISTLMVMMDKGTTGGTGWAIVWAVENTVRLSSASVGTTVVKSLPITDTANWHTAIFTKNGTTARCYIDGVDVSVPGTNVTFSNTTNDLIIGAEQALTLPYSGDIDEPMYFKRALTANEAAELHASAHCDATAYEYVPAINDVQPWVSNAQRWFDPSLSDAQVPYAPSGVTTATVPEQAPLWYDQQVWRSNQQRWYAPDPWDPWHPTATGTGPSPTFFPELLAGAWEPDGNRAPFGMERNVTNAIEPSFQTINPNLTSGFTPGSIPSILINAENGDVFIYAGGSNMIFPAYDGS